jgi:putative flavoprotein involved in K+ transport
LQKSDCVVVATGQCAKPHVPALSLELAPQIHQIHSRGYRHPDALPPGGVLVVGCSATGLQLAEEVRRSGRRVVVSAGPHCRMPRHYRGLDIMSWFEKSGIYYDQPTKKTEVRSPAPSLQLVGSDDGRDIDLQRLARLGVEVTGSLEGLSGGDARFRDDLPELLALSEARMTKVLSRIDAHIEHEEIPAPPGEHPPPLVLPRARTELRLSSEGISTVLWATGYRAELSFLDVGTSRERGHVQHEGGVCAVPGLFLLGMNFMRHRYSSTIAGTIRDARELSPLVRQFAKKETYHAA